MQTITKSQPVTINLNDQQQEAYDLLMNFIENPTVNQMFCLKGYAGTGKTFLISRVIEAIEKKHKYWSIAMTAPTNKAVQVLRESAAVSNKVHFKTIHSLLGLKEEIKESGEIEFTKDYNEEGNTFSNIRVLIIDEVSMLADKLFYEVKRYNNDIKIILMGDPAQIPPVGKEDCEPFLNPELHGIIEFQLTKIMRQGDGSAIVENSMRIREALDNEDIEWTQGNDMKKLCSSSDRQTLANYFDNKYNCPSIDLDQIKVIAWTNRKVASYNDYIRKLLYAENALRFMVGERLVMNKPFLCDNGMEKKFWDMLSTNQEITIKSFVTKRVNFGITKDFDVVAIVYSCRVNYMNKTGVKKTGEIIILHEDSFKSFQHELDSIKTRAITGAMSERRENWKLYYKLLRQVADVSYAYAITAHKSQGSTYNNAIVDVKNICINNNIIERNRILYTAITRAKSELMIIQ